MEIEIRLFHNGNQYGESVFMPPMSEFVAAAVFEKLCKIVDEVNQYE
jgi:hypothetical protein